MSTYLFYLSTEIILDFNPIISYIKVWIKNTGFNVHCVIAYLNQMNGQYKFKEFALIVDSIWLIPILAFGFLLYMIIKDVWFD